MGQRSRTRAGALLLAATLLAGCSAVVTRPPPPGTPVPAFLLDHGRHASLVLPRGEGLARYAYGDWRWFVERRTGSGSALHALFGPSRAALGRGLLEGPATAAAVQRQVGVLVQQLLEIPVEAGRARALTERLDALLADGGEAPPGHPYDLVFVTHPEPYRLGHNSNHVAADWLRALGCTVTGDPTLGKWRIEGRKD